MSDNSEFGASSIILHLIYTFLFSSFNLEESIKDSDQENAFREHLANLLGIDPGGIRLHWTGEDPGQVLRSSDTYLDPYLHLKMSRIEIEWPMSENFLISRLNDGNYDSSLIELSSLRCRTRLLESGQGILEFALRCTPRDIRLFDATTIVHLSNLGMRRAALDGTRDGTDSNLDVSECRLEAGGKEIFLFTKFYETTNSLRDAIRSILRRGKEKPFNWIEKELKLFGDIECHGSLLHFQDPFPIVELTLTRNAYASAFLDQTQVSTMLGRKPGAFFKRKNKRWRSAQMHFFLQLLTILFRSKAFNFPDCSFAGSFTHLTHGRLTNMCSTSLVFLHLYSRSALAIKSDFEEAEKHARYILPAFVETVQYLRMRWHAYVVAAQWLDIIAEKLSENKVPFERARGMIIESKREISRVLSDPLTHRLSSGSMNKIYELGLEIFRIHEIEKIFFEKSNMVDKLYNDLFELKRFRELEEISSQLLKKQ